MSRRAETPWIPVAGLYCDEFREGRIYSNWRPHGSGDWLMIYTVEGAGRFGSGDKAFTTRPGEAVLFAPGDRQDYGTSPEAGHWHLLWAHFLPKPDWQLWLDWPRHPGGTRNIHLEGETREQFCTALLRMIRFAPRNLPGALDMASNALEEALLWANIAAARGVCHGQDPRVSKAADYLLTHLAERFRLDQLAAHCGLSVSRLAHLFREQTGTSPQQFLEQHRMQHAGQLLRLTGLSVAEIANKVGYDDPFYFSSRFRKNHGVSPLQFRKEWTSSPAAEKKRNARLACYPPHARENPQPLTSTPESKKSRSTKRAAG